MAKKFNYKKLYDATAEIVAAAYAVVSDDLSEAMLKIKIDKVFDDVSEGIKIPLSNEDDAKLFLVRCAKKAIEVVGGDADKVTRARSVGIGVDLDMNVHVQFKDMGTVVFSTKSALAFAKDLAQCVNDAIKMSNNASNN